MENVISDYTEKELEYISKFKNDIKNLVSEFTFDTRHFNSYKVYVIFMNNEEFEYESILEDITSLGNDIIRVLENPDIPRELKVSSILGELTSSCGVFCADSRGIIYKIFPTISSNLDKMNDWDSITSHDSNKLFWCIYHEDLDKIYMYTNTDYIDSYHDNTNPDNVNKCVIAVRRYTLKLTHLVEKLLNNIFKGDMKYVYESTYYSPFRC